MSATSLCHAYTVGKNSIDPPRYSGTSREIGKVGVGKIMTTMEFREIQEAWTELKTIYDEIEALNAEEQPGTAFSAFAAQTAAAQ
jgi:hypothetical protein